MPHTRRLAAASAIAIAAAGPAAADLTAAGVWEDMQRYLVAPYGGEVTTEAETPTGSGLRIEGIVMRMEISMPDDAGMDGSSSTSIPYIEFIENGDGTVGIEMAETMTTRSEVATSDGTAVTSLVIEAPGNLTTAREIEGGVAYDTAVPRMTMRLDEMTGPDAVPLDLSLTLEDLTGTYALTGEGTILYDQTFEASAATLDMGAEGEDGAGSFTLAARFEGIASAMTGSAPEEVDMSNPFAAMGAGLTAQGDVTYASSSYTIDVVEETGPTSISGGAAGGGSLSFEMGEGGLGYSVRAEGSEFVMTGGGIPFPEIRAAMARSGFDFLMPAVASDEAAPFRIGMLVEELSVSDQIWGMFDPAGALDRTPWTVILDVTGMARLDVNIMDPEAMQSMDPDVPPGMVESASIDALRLSVLGADVSGTGAVTFDESDMETFGGIPAPDGRIDLSMTGVEALMDQIVSLGLVPEDQVMMGRMMLGLFARNVGPDAYETTLEIKPDGSVLANGQPLQ